MAPSEEKDRELTAVRRPWRVVGIDSGRSSRECGGGTEFVAALRLGGQIAQAENGLGDGLCRILIAERLREVVDDVKGMERDSTCAIVRKDVRCDDWRWWAKLGPVWWAL